MRKVFCLCLSLSFLFLLHYAHFSIQKQGIVDEKFYLLSFDRSSTTRCQIDTILSYIPVSIRKTRSIEHL